MTDDFKITVLNPKGADPEQYFSGFAGNADPGIHAPVNFHAYAACVAGSFQRDVNKAIELNRPVLMLIRKDMKYCLRVLRKLKDAGLKVAVTLKETGFHQFASQLPSVKQLNPFKEILNSADGVISPTQALVPVYRALRSQSPERVAFIPTPYPVDNPNWDFSIPIAERKGILIGTRNLKTPSRNHLLSMILVAGLAKRLNVPVGMINMDGNMAEQFMHKLNFSKSNVTIKSRMNYPDYLHFMAAHRLVFQLDMSLVPGQVAGDCSLCRSICIGGNSSIESLIFTGFINSNQDLGGLLESAERLLTDDQFYQKSIDEAHSKAVELISYKSVANKLRQFFSAI